MGTYQTSNYEEQGGARTVIGGSLDIASGGDLDIESGGSLKIAGTQVTATAAQLNASAGVTAGTVTASKAVVVDANKDIASFRNVTLAGKLNLGLNGGAASASGVLMGVGTTAGPAVSATADAKFIEVRASTTAAEASDARLAYLRMAFDGEHASAGGETIRALSMVNENIGTAHGAHISLGFKAEAGGSETAGIGAAVRATLHIPDIASWAPTGTYAAGYFEVYSDGTASDPAGMTCLSVLTLANSGDATGKADVDTDAVLFDLPGWSAGSGSLFDSTVNTAGAQIDHTLKIRLPTGAIGYIPVMDNADGS